MTAAATFCATLVDEWARAGVTDAVVCPGSRSTPMALALAADPRLRLHVHHDERAAGFVALGLGRATGRPAVVLTTSGTAAVELHPAVVEASQAGVPLLACTADRPPELQHVGAPQTVDQVHLFGRAARWFADPGPPDGAAAGSWRSLAARAVAEATGSPPGPVHLNLAFRDPLVGEPGDLPPGRPHGAPWHTSSPAAPAGPPPTRLPARTVVVAGEGAGDPAAVLEMAAVRGWPVLADPRSGTRAPAPTTVAAADALLREPATAERLRPDAVLRLGAPPASKVVAQWLARSGAGARQVAVDRHGRWWDPERTAAEVVVASPTDVCEALARVRTGPAPDPDWLGAWSAAEAAAQAAIDLVLAGHPEPTEPGLARALAAALPDGSTLVVSSSMPVRDVEWYAEPRTGLRVLANRGANGIDGVVSTAVGVALADRGGPVAALVGDVAFLHDANALLGAPARGLDLVVVVVDNDGGGIFSFLPQAATLPGDRFERLFGTPHGADPAALGAAWGVPTTRLTAMAGLAPALAGTGTRLVHVRTDRAANVAVHDELHAAVAAALTP